MNIAEYGIKRPVITWMIVLIFLVGGAFAYFHLGRYEDPEFTIKEALVITKYPGATPKEVEEEVTEKIEKAINQMGQVKEQKSISRFGESEITVKMKDKYDAKSLPQVWDELRRKVNDVQSQLPQGAMHSTVVDDYGDVYGMFFAMTGDGFSYRELDDYAEFMKKELSLVKGVAKVDLDGVRQQAIYVDISRSKMAQLGISTEQIKAALRAKNTPVLSGSVRVGNEYIRIQPTGALDTVKDIGNTLITTKSGSSIYLSDFSTIKKTYLEVPNKMVYFNGKPAITLGVSITQGGNVVKIGEAISARGKQLLNQIPIGITFHAIYNQPELVVASIKGFMVSLIEALVIVVVVLLIFMGLRSGIIIAAILWLTVIGTLFVMYLTAIDLQRISLGALIIALGMLVDNAIVVAEGILIKVQQGISALKASRDVVNQTIWPLLGATVVGVLAFAPIGLSNDSTGEYTRSLFYVILISLFLSWVFAVMVTPLFCHLLLKPGKPSDNANTNDAYQHGLYRGYRAFLQGCMRAKYLTVFVMVGLLALSVYGFGYVKQSFFPDSTTPMFYVDFWLPQGTDIRATQKDMNAIAKHIQKMQGVNTVTQVVGKGAARFTLVFTPEKPNTSYGQFLIGVKNWQEIDKISQAVKQYMLDNYPNSTPKIQKIRLGPGGGAKIEIRILGQDPVILRKLSNEVQHIMHQNPEAIDIRDDWRERVKIIEPLYSQEVARRTGVSRKDLSNALQLAYSGLNVGLYRDKDKLIPIYVRPPAQERLNIGNIDEVPVWSPLLARNLPLGQVVDGIRIAWADDIIRHKDLKRTITVSCEPKNILASRLFDQIREKVLETVKLPAGYELQWGGEYENSTDAQAALATKLPVGIITMIIIVVLLFGRVRQPLIIWLCVPLSLIGVTAGLLITNSEFGFMALLGFLSLSGMLIKNAIVLVDQIDLEVKEGKPVWQAILDSAVGRMRPVSLAAVTTILGMIPLLPDIFFRSMAVTIMFGLGFATVLTLIFVPVLYAIFFKARPIY